MKQTCGNCLCYLTDVDENENLTDFHHDRNKPDGFCAIRDLFYNVKKDERPCEEWEYDRED